VTSGHGQLRGIGSGHSARRLAIGGALALVVTLVAIALGASGQGSHPGAAGRAPAGPPTRPASGPGATPAAASRGRKRPNIVFVLTDDLSTNLVAFMPHVESMESAGLTFSNYFVSDSLCCPSRASIFTGNFPHDTHVYNNVGKRGGFRVFHARGEERHTFALALQRAGYRTAMMGKYLNGYLGGPGSAPGVPATYVPPGWNEWDVAGDGYPEFDYDMNENGVVRHYGHEPADYLTDVLARQGTAFIRRSASSGRPFFLELATFAPHRPYTPAPQDVGAFPAARAPRLPNFDVLPTDPPSWLANRSPLSAADITEIDHDFRLRAEAVQSVDRMIGSIQQTLRAEHVARDTYIVFSSDNGLHMGQYRLHPGKLTAFDSDIRVPLVIDGPGVPIGVKTTAMAENIDLGPTFAQLGGTRLRADGHSLVPLLRGAVPPNWRNAILVEHRGPVKRPHNPDYQGPGSGNPPSYEAMRTGRFLYVEYRNGDREYYDLVTDPFELHNEAGQLRPSRLAALHAALVALRRCHGAKACWAAMHVSTGAGP
jgi:N-acetylglucosamine-6-sulfatase